MDKNYGTDTFFFTKQNASKQPNSLRSFKHSLSVPMQSKKQQLQDMFDQYHLFKYSKCFIPRRKSHVQAQNTQRATNQNYKSIKKESDKLKQRLGEMQTQRKQLLSQLRMQNK